MSLADPIGQMLVQTRRDCTTCPASTLPGTRDPSTGSNRGRLPEMCSLTMLELHDPRALEGKNIREQRDFRSGVAPTVGPELIKRDGLRNQGLGLRRNFPFFDICAPAPGRLPPPGSPFSPFSPFLNFLKMFSFVSLLWRISPFSDFHLKIGYAKETPRNGFLWRFYPKQFFYKSNVEIYFCEYAVPDIP